MVGLGQLGIMSPIQTAN